MSLSKAIATKDLGLLEETVAKAAKVYTAAKPAEVLVDTVYGSLPFSALFDEESKWAVIAGAYAAVVQAVSKIPKDLDVDVETAKIIATNAVLRNVSSTSTRAEGSLL